MLFIGDLNSLISENEMNIVILEGGIVTSDKKKVAEKLNNYFIYSGCNLAIASFVQDCMPADINDADPDKGMDYIDNLVMKYKKHPSIVKMKENVIINNKFEFIDVTYVLKTIYHPKYELVVMT